MESYEYRGMMVTAWDLLRGDTSNWPDRFFYRDLIVRYGQPVLDVGCGTGRLLLDYLAQGIDIDGVDVSPEMLAICAEKAQRLGLHPRVFEQVMQELDLPRTYCTIMVPSSSFQLLTDPHFELAEQIEATEDRYEVLRDGAGVATEMHVRSPATRWYTQQQALHLYEEAGFTSMQIFKEFSEEPASAEETMFSIVGMRP